MNSGLSILPLKIGVNHTFQKSLSIVILKIRTCFYFFNEQVLGACYFLINIHTTNNTSARDKLKVIVRTIVVAAKEDAAVANVNESKLHNIVISEGNKAYHIMEVDLENSKRFFTSYKNLVELVSGVISAVNPDFKYPYVLAPNLFEMSNNHICFAEHLPRLTDISTEKGMVNEVEFMLNYFLDKLMS